MPRNPETYNEYMRKYMLARYTKRRATAIAAKGGTCQRCEATDELHFHHVDPTTKEFTIAKGSSFSDQRWNAEIAKCELLCEECHVNEHNSRVLS